MPHGSVCPLYWHLHGPSDMPGVLLPQDSSALVAPMPGRLPPDLLSQLELYRHVFTSKKREGNEH